MESSPGSFADLVRGYRNRAALTQRELAARAAVSVRALRDMERGRVHRPQSDSVQRLAAALRLSDEDNAILLAAVAGDPVRDDSSRVRIGVLGSLLVRCGGLELVVKAPKQRCLLGLLALQPNQLVSHDEIVDVLWGQEPPGSCLGLVHTYVNRLRATVEVDRADGEPGANPRLVARSRQGYLLEADHNQLDMLQFVDLAERAAKARTAGDAAVACELYATALAVWRGPLLPGFPAPLRQHPAAVALSRQRTEVAIAHADLAVGLGRADQAITVLLMLAEDEPLHEGLHARLILALAASGQQAAALRRFVDVQARLAEDLGIEPGAELKAAQLRVLRQQMPSVNGARSSRDAQASAGRPRIGDGAPVPAQLPAAVPCFVGRGSHLRLLDTILIKAAERGRGIAPCVISGLPGVGKTSLAVQWAHRARHHLRDGQLYVDLRGYSQLPPMRSLDALALFLRALGVPPEDVPLDLDEAAALYRTLLVDRRMVVILDNARDPQQVRPLLPGNENCAVLVTSRDSLTGLVARDGAHPLTLDVLSPAEASALLARVVGNARARRELAAVAELAGLCGHLPLALRIASANLIGDPERRIATYVAELRDGNRLAALDVEGDAQAAIGPAFALSYGCLPPDARELFRRLGPAPCLDFTPTIAAALLDTIGPVAVRLMDRLVSAHLLNRSAANRYSMHDLVRLYAVECSSEEDSEPSRQRANRHLFDHYLQVVDRAARRLYPEQVRLAIPRARDRRFEPEFANAMDARAWLDAERANLVAAIAHGAAHGPREPARLLADALRPYFALGLRIAEWIAVTDAAKSGAEAAGDLRGMATAQLSLATIRWRLGRYADAIHHYEQALQLGRQAGWLEVQSAALNGCGHIRLRSGQPYKAVDCYQLAETINRQADDRLGHAVSLGGLGGAYWFLGQITRADAYYQRALTACREARSRNGEAIVLMNVGMTQHVLGRHDVALGNLEQAVALHRLTGNRDAEADSLHNLAGVHRDAGRLPLAAELARTALAIVRETGEPRTEANVLNTLGTIQQRLGQHREAAASHTRALHLARTTGTRYPEIAALIGLAIAQQDELEPSVNNAECAIKVAGALGCRLLEGQAHTALATVYAGHGLRDAALRHARRALAIHPETGYRLGEAHTLLLLSDLLDGSDGSAVPTRYARGVPAIPDRAEPWRKH